ncbi:NADP-dependent oxidoreductase [Streptomyces sp. NPDC050560]|uniref:NADP-dependent oxidoreductase n=1 Tax=Streptomyces sp. NPDC050560 TaxID=3365630 RepID=UPI0037AC481D
MSGTTEHLPATGLAWHLARRPEGPATAEDFALREIPVVPPEEGSVLVRNRYFSVDPYMRGRMNDVKSYTPPYRLDHPMDGGAAGEVIASRAAGFEPGDLVVHGRGWREYATVPADTCVRADTALAPLSAYLGVLGMTGLTAYAGLLDVASFRPGETVFVSGAAGAVGSQVGQIARLKGAARVVGSAGSAQKVRLLVDEFGFDAAFNYKDGPVVGQLRPLVPDGVDVYFDNVGGEHLEAALSRMNVHGRITVCGMIAQYDGAPGPAPRNLALLIGKRLRMQGMLVGDHERLRPRFVEEVSGWLREGRLTYRETVLHGIERGAEAFLGLMRGENTGKMLVALDG